MVEVYSSTRLVYYEMGFWKLPPWRFCSLGSVGLYMKWHCCAYSVSKIGMFKHWQFHLSVMQVHKTLPCRTHLTYAFSCGLGGIAIYDLVTKPSSCKWMAVGNAYYLCNWGRLIFEIQTHHISRKLWLLQKIQQTAWSIQRRIDRGDGRSKIRLGHMMPIRLWSTEWINQLQTPPCFFLSLETRRSVRW